MGFVGLSSWEWAYEPWRTIRPSRLPEGGVPQWNDPMNLDGSVSESDVKVSTEEDRTELPE